MLTGKRKWDGDWSTKLQDGILRVLEGGSVPLRFDGKDKKVKKQVKETNKAIKNVEKAEGESPVILDALAYEEKNGDRLESTMDCLVAEFKKLKDDFNKTEKTNAKKFKKLEENVKELEENDKKKALQIEWLNKKVAVLESFPIMIKKFPSPFLGCE